MIGWLRGLFEGTPERFISFQEDGTLLATTKHWHSSIDYAIRHCLGGSWDKHRKGWVISTQQPGILDFAEEWGFKVEKYTSLRLFLKGDLASTRLEESCATSGDFDVKGLGKELLPYQKTGVKYAARERRCIIGDAPGLGKTCQALATLQYLDAFPALIVCPAVAVSKWVAEAEAWLPGRTVAAIPSRRVFPANTDILIGSYEMARTHIWRLQKRGLKALVLDESQYVKNWSASRTHKFLELSRGIWVRLLLTGTVVKNCPEELVPQLEIIERLDDFGGKHDFLERYGGGRHTEELNQRLRATCYIRREKDDVIDELNPPVSKVVPLEISNRGEYAFAELTTLQERTKYPANHVNRLQRVTQLRQIAAEGKVSAINWWLDDFFWQHPGEKVVVFTHHRRVTDAIADRWGAHKIVGGMTAAQRDYAQKEFQTNPKCRIIVVSTQCAGTAIDLFAANNVVFAELSWTPADHEQALSRCHRIGQKQRVNVFYLVAEGTIEEDMMRLVDKKSGVVEPTIHGNQPSTHLIALLERSISERY